MLEIINVVLPVFLTILIGYLIGRKREFNIQIIVDMIVYIASPCLIFTSMARSEASFSDFSTIFIAAVFVIVVQAVIVYLVLKGRKSSKKGLYLPLTIGNTGYIGYPIALFAYGAIGLSNAIVFDVVSSLFLFSVGIYIVHHKNDFMEVFKVPLIYAVVFGMVFNIFKITVPDMIFKPLSMIGGIAIPAALLVLGYRLTKIKISSANIAFFASCFKIFGGVLLALLITYLLKIDGVMRNVIILQAAMPSAVMSMILAHKYGRDSEIIASVVFVSTLMSVVTIPLILFFLS